MAPFDGPALATAKSHIATINKAGHEGEAPHLQHAGQQAGDREGVRAEAPLQGADVIMTTCDVDYAAPVVQEAINAGSSPSRLHRHRPDGPEALRAEGEARLLLTATSRRTRARRWPSSRGSRAGAPRRSRRTRYRLLPQRRSGVQGALEAARREDRAEETYQSLGGNPASWQSTVTRLNAKQADVIVTSTAAAFGAQVPILNGLRTLGNNTPFLNSWAGDGNYWYTPDPKITNYYYVTFASAFGDDPVKAVNALAKRTRRSRRRAARAASSPARRRSTGSSRPSSGQGLDERRGARGADGEVQERADAVGARELLDAAAHGVRPAVPRDQRPEQHARRSSERSRPRSSRRSRIGGARRAPADAAARSIAPGRRRLARVRGRAGAARRHARAAPARGRRPHRPERRRQVDARERAHRIRLPRRGLGRARRT